MKVQDVISILKNLRIKGIYEEYEIQDEISKLLKDHNIMFTKEYKLGPRNRIDFLLPDGIGIEVKKGKPNRARTVAQLERYTEFQQIKSIILVIERSMDIPKAINNKPCFSIGLNKQWGIAL